MVRVLIDYFSALFIGLQYRKTVPIRGGNFTPALSLEIRAADSSSGRTKRPTVEEELTEEAGLEDEEELAEKAELAKGAELEEEELAEGAELRGSVDSVEKKASDVCLGHVIMSCGVSVVTLYN